MSRGAKLDDGATSRFRTEDLQIHNPGEVREAREPADKLPVARITRNAAVRSQPETDPTPAARSDQSCRSSQSDMGVSCAVNREGMSSIGTRKGFALFLKR